MLELLLMFSTSLPAAGVGDPPPSGDGVPPLSHERQDHLHLHEDEEEDGWSA